MGAACCVHNDFTHDIRLKPLYPLLQSGAALKRGASFDLNTVLHQLFLEK
jgi:hypothetical protein